jgi:apolipoprotein D and lipocalin family protein
MRPLFRAVFCLWLLAGCVTPARPDLILAPDVDLDRYVGRWYVIAHIPYWAERGVVGSFDEYARRPDGSLSNVFNGHDKSLDARLDRTVGHAEIVPGTGNARWRVSFIWPIYVSYLILYVDPDYRYALIGYPDRALGWVLSRDPMIDDTTYRGLLDRFAAEGYDVSQFRRVPQITAQIGAPGFDE